MTRIPWKAAWLARLSIVVTLSTVAMLLSLSTSPIAQAAPATQVCGNMDSINNLGPYWINNNLWGAGSGSGSQCSWDNSISGSTLSWGTSWNWSGQANSVKSFASAVLGWHWGYKQSGTGLPVQLSSNTNVNTSWSFSLSGSSSQDVSYDIWADPNPNLGSTQASNEIMVWLYKSGSIQPVGSPVGDVSIDGTTWTLWYGNIGWNVYSFVRDSNTTSASLNLNDFFQNLISSHGLSSANYLLGVESGTEIFTGSGQLNVQSYSTTVGGSGGGGGGGASGAIHAPGGKCVDVAGGNSASGTRVQLWDCNGASAQNWTVASNGTLQALGKCLDIIGNGTAPGTKVQLWDCNGVGGQQWVPQANGSLLNPQSGLCLDDPGGNTTDGTQLQIWNCNNLWPQVYQLPGRALLGAIGAPGGKCVDVQGANSTSGTPVQLYDCNGTAAQTWTVASDGTLQALGKCLDIIGNGTAPGTKVQIWDCNGVGGQQWRPQANGSLLNPQSGLCLDDPAGNTANGTQLQIWNCNNLWPQVYQLP